MKILRTANGSLMKVSDNLAKVMVEDSPYDYYYATKKEWKREERDRELNLVTKEDDAILDMIIN